MTNKVEGGCLCGAVRYSCDADQIGGAAVCHCRDCGTPMFGELAAAPQWAHINEAIPQFEKAPG